MTNIGHLSKLINVNKKDLGRSVRHFSLAFDAGIDSGSIARINCDQVKEVVGAFVENIQR